MWQLAPVLDHFLQVFPHEGDPETERTEARILYDDHALYIAFRCWDSQAQTITPRLGRRDVLPASDFVGVYVDSQHDGRAAFEFLVNVAGLQADAIATEGQDDNFDWDGVWESETHIDPQGWTVEIAIPFSTLRFPRTSPQTWGLHIIRYHSRLREQTAWNLIRMTDASQIGRFAELVDIDGAKPGLSLQIIPYAAAQVRASFASDSLAPRDAGKLSAGVDAKYALGGALTLDASFNPDFAQVEVDPEVVNLSAYEVYFPEKRPFFLEGLDLFNVQGGALVYTRRIGAPPEVPDPQHGGNIVQLDPPARIIGALKLTGNLRPGTGIGVLGAYVDETNAVERESGPLSPSWVDQASPASWFQALRVRQVVSGQSTVGLTETTVLRGHSDPTLWQDAHSLVMDWDVRGRSDYTMSGAAGRTFTKACDPRYSTSFHGSGICDPFGANLTFGKTGGELQLAETLDYTGSEVDLNDMGFLQHLVGNQSVGQAVSATYSRLRPWRGLKQIYLNLFYHTGWDPNAGMGPDSTPLTDNRVSAFAKIWFHNDWMAFLQANHAFAAFDDAETRLNPVVRLYSRDGFENYLFGGLTNPSKPFSVGTENTLNYDHRTQSWTANFTTDLRVLTGNRLQLGLHLGWLSHFDRPRWVAAETMAPFKPLFGVLEMRQFETSLRGTLAFTRDLTLQVFSQLLVSQQHYPHVMELADARTFVPCDDASTCANAAAPGYYDANLSSLIVDAIARWQFRPGSTVFMVYTHNHQVSSSSLSSLTQSPADNVIALKLSYLWAL